MKQTINNELISHLETINKVIETMQDKVEIASKLAVETIKNGNKILLCGNGGSAADAQHIAAELTGKYKTERKGLPAIALTTDTSALTAIANDYGYDRIFDRQIEALANNGDLIIGISTSGNSKNIVYLYDLCDDYRKGKKVNHTYKHATARLEIYEGEEFNYELIEERI